MGKAYSKLVKELEKQIDAALKKKFPDVKLSGASHGGADTEDWDEYRTDVDRQTGLFGFMVFPKGELQEEFGAGEAVFQVQGVRSDKKGVKSYRSLNLDKIEFTRKSDGKKFEFWVREW